MPNLAVPKGKLIVTSSAPAPILYDSFTAANGTDVNGRTPSPIAPSGSVWSVVQGAIDIQNNKANPATFNSSRVIATIESGKADLNYRITWQSGQSAGTADFISIFFRYQDTQNNWFVRLGRSGGTTNLWQICELVANTTTVRATGDYTYAANTTYVISIIANGASITATRDGGTQLSYGSAGTFLTKTPIGFMLFMDGFTNKSAIDNVQVYKL